MRRIIVSDFNKRLDEQWRQWAKSSRLDLGVNDDGDYDKWTTHIAWSAWMAASKIALEEFAKLEPSEKVITAGQDAIPEDWDYGVRDRDLAAGYRAMLAAQVREIKEGK
jgi:hypothetical protein